MPPLRRRTHPSPSDHPLTLTVPHSCTCCWCRVACTAHPSRLSGEPPVPHRSDPVPPRRPRAPPRPPSPRRRRNTIMVGAVYAQPAAATGGGRGATPPPAPRGAAGLRRLCGVLCHTLRGAPFGAAAPASHAPPRALNAPPPSTDPSTSYSGAPPSPSYGVPPFHALARRRAPFPDAPYLNVRASRDTPDSVASRSSHKTGPVTMGVRASGRLCTCPAQSSLLNI